MISTRRTTAFDLLKRSLKLIMSRRMNQQVAIQSMARLKRQLAVQKMLFPQAPIPRLSYTIRNDVISFHMSSVPGAKPMTPVKLQFLRKMLPHTPLLEHLETKPKKIKVAGKVLSHFSRDEMRFGDGLYKKRGG